jgi:hypothetical protein
MNNDHGGEGVENDIRKSKWWVRQENSMSSSLGMRGIFHDVHGVNTHAPHGTKIKSHMYEIWIMKVYTMKVICASFSDNQ